MWNELNYAWQEAFSLAWESFKNNTIPIGAVIANDKGNIVSRGRNRIYDKTSSNPLAGTYMAHAEMTAMMSLKEIEHPNIKHYTLFTTMEPCPMCFGTMVMMGIRNLQYAAKDGFAGATELNQKMQYIRSKNINIVEIGSELQAFQICLQSCYEYIRMHKRINEILDSFKPYCEEGVFLGKQLHENGYFSKAINEDIPIQEIYDDVIKKLSYIKKDVI